MHFLVNMTKDLEPDNILISVHKGLETFRPLLETTITSRRYVAKQDTDLSICLHLVQSLLEPLELVARVVSELHQEEVSVVARFSVNSDYSDLVHLCTIA